jgi:hypothetical protein
MDKYIKELVSEMYFEVADITYGHTFQEIGYEDKHDFFVELKKKLAELEARLTTTEEV